MKAGHVVLIGYRGTGKSTVARHLARAWGRPAVDSDDEIGRRSGKTIRAIFAEDGEQAFRDLESQALVDLLAGEPSVLATGGGVILRAENRDLLASAGHVVWLRASPETIVHRMAADPASAETRPPLTSKDAVTEVAEMLRIRGPLYQSCAQEIVDTDAKSPVEVAAEVQSRLPVPFQPDHSEPGESA